MITPGPDVRPIVEETSDGKRYINWIADKRYIWYKYGSIDAWMVDYNPYGPKYDLDWQMLCVLDDLQDLVGPLVWSDVQKIYNLVPCHNPDFGFVIPTEEKVYTLKEMAQKTYGRLGDIDVWSFTDDGKRLADRVRVNAVKWTEQLYVYVYYVMISESNKKNKNGSPVPLGKLVKLLGIYQALTKEFKQWGIQKADEDMVLCKESDEDRVRGALYYTYLEVSKNSCCEPGQRGKAKQIFEECKKRGLK